jgi:hypothetical protein
MFVNRTNVLGLLGLLIVTLLVSDPASAQEKSPRPATDEWASKLLVEEFDAVQKAIKPQPGESRWMEIPWQTSLWEARKMAAEQGKPIFLWFGSGGSPACHT